MSMAAAARSGAFKQLVREQFFMLLPDEDRAIDAIPIMVSSDKEGASRAHGDLRRLIEAVGLRTETGRARLAQIDGMFAAIEKESMLNIDRLGKAIAVDLHTGPSRRGRGAKKTAA
jgi:hypothetical protein